MDIICLSSTTHLSKIKIKKLYLKNEKNKTISNII